MKKIVAMILMLMIALNLTLAFGEGSGSTPPAMPDGTPPTDMGTPPDGMGTPPNGTMGTPPDGMGTPPNGAMGTPPEGMGGMGMGGPGGEERTENSGTGATTVATGQSLSGLNYASENADENALRIEGGATVTGENITVTKTGESSNPEDSDFYGLNAGVLVRDGATLSLNSSTVTTDGQGGNGVFAYGSGTTAILSNLVIRTTKDNSGGIELAGGATINATNLDIETNGKSSAALRSDRGGGVMTVSGGTYVTHGTGSPAVYSTADVTVENAALTATASEAIVIEGKNSVTLTDCTVSGNMTGTYGNDSTENIHGVMLYQSMSGDADVGQSHFAMTGGSLASLSGDTIYVTNTACTIYLNSVAVTNAQGNLLTVSGNTSARGWGVQGANGGTCEMTTSAQTLEGTIAVDSISSLALSMAEGSAFLGDIQGQGTVNLTMDETSTWMLTADSYVTSFTGSLDQVDANGFHLYVNGAMIK